MKEKEKTPLPKGTNVIPKIDVTEEEIRQTSKKISSGMSPLDAERLNKIMSEEQN